MRIDSTGTGVDSLAAAGAIAVVSGSVTAAAWVSASVEDLVGVLVEQADVMMAAPITITGILMKVLRALISKVFSPLIIRGFQEFS